MRQQKYYEAYLDDFDKITVFMSRNSYEGVSNKFYLKDTRGHIYDIHILLKQLIAITINIRWLFMIQLK